MTGRVNEAPAELARRIAAATGPCSLLLIGAREAGLLVKDAFVLVDRQQGARSA